MKATNYARFANGDVATRRSEADYKFAYCAHISRDLSVKVKGPVLNGREKIGFALTRENAVKAASSTGLSYYERIDAVEIVETSKM